ncbi:MAG: thioredoxin domain-containing protein, partial [Propionibacterium sp.]|nr:thioredoxin domain-containing protein [Propionibacterium sp.]
DASARAAMAAAAADEVGHFKEYHSVLFQNQSQYTQRQLREEFPAQAGIEGEDLERFQELYNTRAFRDFVTVSHNAFLEDQIGATPTFVVGGQRLLFLDEATNETLIQPTPESFMAAVLPAFNGEDARTHTPMP